MFHNIVYNMKYRICHSEYIITSLLYECPDDDGGLMDSFLNFRYLNHRKFLDKKDLSPIQLCRKKK